MLFMMLLADRPDDADYLEDIYHTHYRLLYAQALKVLRHPQDAEDVVQAVMLKMTQKIHILRRLECNKQASYLVISVRNTAINLYRKNKSRAMRQAELIEDIVSADMKENPEDQTLDRDAVEQVKDAIRRLPRRERDAMTLRYVLNLMDTQVADTLGIQAVSARALLSRGRKRLREMLAEGRD